MEVYIRGRRIRPKPNQSIGKGGEADVFDIGAGKALKVFKPPNHPDYVNLPYEQQAARQRIAEHQKKLKAFPQNLPARVITPEDLATDKAGNKILGYTMKFLKGAEVLLRYADRGFRQTGVANETVIEIFKDLHKTVAGTHQAGVVIGDFNDLNVLVLGQQAYLIDADSFQFGKFYCKLFTARFVDPLLCDPKDTKLMLVSPHNAKSDWYSFTVMLMQCLLFVDPYGGIYRPRDKRKRIPHQARPLYRITVFHPEVKYPKPATPYKVLPDELLQYFHQVFEQDEREEFPLRLLEILRWTKCTKCGTEHARSLCPECAQVSPVAQKAVTIIRGRVTAKRIFRTSGVILFAAVQGNELGWLYHENDQFKREDTSVVVSGRLDPQMRFRLFGQSTLMAKNGQVLAFTPDQELSKLTVDSFGNLPIFDANNRFRYWLQSGQLMRDGQFAPEYVGDVLQDQTLFWVGPNFGFGFYRAGNLSVAFVFDAIRKGINDNVKLPPIRGQLVDSTCVFSKERCWFLISTRGKGKTINQCFVLRANGDIVATAEADEGDGSWLGKLRGNCAVGNFLLAATDDGIVRLEPDQGKIVKTREFPDTESFVDSGCHLFAGKEGLYVVNRKEIKLLKIS